MLRVEVDGKAKYEDASKVTQDMYVFAIEKKSKME